MKAIIDKLGFIKIKNFYSVRYNIQIIERQAKMVRKHLQKTHVIKDCYPKYTKDS